MHAADIKDFTDLKQVVDMLKSPLIKDRIKMQMLEDAIVDCNKQRIILQNELTSVEESLEEYRKYTGEKLKDLKTSPSELYGEGNKVRLDTYRSTGKGKDFDFIDGISDMSKYCFWGLLLLQVFVSKLSQANPLDRCKYNTVSISMITINGFIYILSKAFKSKN